MVVTLILDFVEGRVATLYHISFARGSPFKTFSWDDHSKKSYAGETEKDAMLAGIQWLQSHDFNDIDDAEDVS